MLFKLYINYVSKAYPSALVARYPVVDDSLPLYMIASAWRIGNRHFSSLCFVEDEGSGSDANGYGRKNPNPNLGEILPPSFSI
jgi:hypothetical protein